MNKKLDETIFHVVLLCILALAVVMSFSYNPTARGFPLAFGIIGFVMVGLQLVVNVLKSPPAVLQFLNRKGALSKSKSGEKEAKEEPEMTWGKFFKLICWLIGYTVFIGLTHYLIATFVFLILFMRFAGDVRWVTTIIYSTAFTGGMYIIFEELIRQ